MSSPKTTNQQAAVEAVRRVVGLVPPGNVTTYGEVAKVAGVGPRYVGWVMRTHGADLPWWRVVRADGTTHDPARALPRWDEEGIGASGAKAVLSLHGLDARDLKGLTG
ncbi:MGMT family protein [Corynebacterium phocae]|uniref:MGMT family protein n=1 Tax=Corynebacterium phocae TaxID=161895 RepID=UPI001FE43FF5|nr:MGMT family protein [Corynebacterium phocae]